MKEGGRSTRSRWNPRFLESLALGVFLFFATGYWHDKGFLNGSSLSRLDCIHSLYYEHRLEIDSYHENTADTAFVNGHFYSDKAPFFTLAALPAFALATRLFDTIPPDRVEIQWLHESWICTLGTSCLSVAIGGVAAYLSLLPHFNPRIALLSVLFIFLGTPVWPLCTFFISHSFVVGLLSIAYGLSYFLPNVSLRRGWAVAVASGGCAGAAISSEYSSGIFVVSLGFTYALRKNFTPFIIGLLPALLVVAANNIMTTDSLFELPYSYQNSYPEMKSGLYAIQLPSLITAWNLLASPARGLFFWSPFLLIALAKFGLSIWQRPRDFGILYCATLLHVLVISGRTWDWQGGAAFGARLLLPLLPGMLYPCALAIRDVPGLTVALGIVSVLLNGAAVITRTTLEPSFNSPLTQVNLLLIKRLSLNYNIAAFVGFSREQGLCFFLLVFFLTAIVLLLLAKCNASPSGDPPWPRTHQLPAPGTGKG
jgi:hypothetical protein